MTEPELAQRFAAEFGASPRLFSAPGRINLIGEHTDYNDGFVLPMAIELRTYVAACARDSRRLTVKSLERDGIAQIDLDAPGSKRRGTWFDYVEGTARALLERGYPLRGADLLIRSDVPLGGGLSSSAALEMSVGFALCSISGVDPDRTELARAGQQAEHEYVGTLCGIMDQYVSAMARADHGLLIDCRTLGTDAIPLPLGDAAILVCDSGVRHELASSAYNERRRECERAAALLGAASLRDVTAAALDRAPAGLSDVLLRRARHVVTENARTLSAADAFRRRDLERAGRLMLESHASLRDDYEVSCPELDCLVAAATPLEGVYGARMTGGGFGGSAIVLLRADRVQAALRELEGVYRARFGRRLAGFVTRAKDGVFEHEV